MPAQCLFQAGEYAGAALQATIRLGTHIAILIERVNLGWTDEKTVFWLAFGAADFLVYPYMPLLVDLEDVLAEFLFHLQINLTLYLQQPKHIFQS